MSVVMLLFWTAVIAGVIWLVRAAGRPSHDRVSLDKHETADRPRPSARDTLDQRYAQGELSDEEYRARRDALLRG